MSDRWYYRTLGEQFGPVTEETILNLIETGIVGQSDEIRLGQGAWTSLQALSASSAHDGASQTGKHPSPSTNESQAGDHSEKAEWYYRGTGGNGGPLTMAQLLDGVQQGTITPETQIAIASKRTWTRAQDVAGLFPADTSSPVSAPAETTDPVKPQTPESRVATAAMRDALRYLQQRDAQLSGQTPRRSRQSRVISFHGITWLSSAITGVFASLIELAGRTIWPVLRLKLVWALLGVVLAGWAATTIREHWLTQRSAYEMLAESVAEFRALRQQQATDSQWEEFERQTRRELAQLVPRLEQSATSEDPASMQLMYVARDYLPQLLSEDREQPSETEEKIEYHLQRTERLLRDSPFWNAWRRNGTMIGIAVCELLLLLTGLWWWRRAT